MTFAGYQGPNYLKHLLPGFTFLVMLFIILPMLVIIPVSFNPGEGMEFPPSGISLRWYGEALTSDLWIKPILTSTVIALIATIVAGVLGTLTSYAIVRFKFRGRQLLIGFLISPLVFPSVMYGLAMLLFLNSLGIRGALLGLLSAHCVIVFPYFLRTVGAVLISADVQTLEEAARSLGASSARAFLGITIPSIRSGILAGALFSFIMSFIEFDLTSFLMTSKLQTLPYVIFRHLTYFYNADVAAISSILLILALIIIALMEKTLGLENYFRL